MRMCVAKDDDCCRPVLSRLILQINRALTVTVTLITHVRQLFWPQSKRKSHDIDDDNSNRAKLYGTIEPI